jgi:hypothetical protein
VEPQGSHPEVRVTSHTSLKASQRLLTVSDGCCRVCNVSQVNNERWTPLCQSWGAIGIQYWCDAVAVGFDLWAAPAVKICDGCCEPRETSPYDLTYLNRKSERVDYCDDCAGLVRMNFNGETAAIAEVSP